MQARPVGRPSGKLYEVHVCGTCRETFLWHAARVGNETYCSRKCSALARVGRLTTEAGEIARRYVAGETLREIGDSYGVSRERIRQVITKSHGRLRIVKRVTRITLLREARKDAIGTCRVCLKPIVPETVTERTLLNARPRGTIRPRVTHGGECSELYTSLRWYLSPTFREKLLAHCRQQRAERGVKAKRAYTRRSEPRSGKIMTHWKRMLELREGK